MTPTHDPYLIVQVTKLYYERIDLIMKLRLAGQKMTLSEEVSTLMKIRQTGDTLNALCGARLFESETR